MKDHEFIEFIKELLLAPDTVIKKAHIARLVSMIIACERQIAALEEEGQEGARINNHNVEIFTQQIAVLTAERDKLFDTVRRYEKYDPNIVESASDIDERVAEFDKQQALRGEEVNDDTNNIS